MKTRLLLAVAVAAVIGITSCNGGDSKLAGELVGTWKGASGCVNSNRGNGGEMTCTPTFTFVRTDGTNGGTITIATDYTVAKDVETLASNLPVKATVNGNVDASGTWTVKDGDEIIVNLDPSKTVVNVDTSSLALNYATFTDAPVDSLNKIRARVAANVPDVVKHMVAGKVQKMRKFDDVRITGNTMTLEVGNDKITLIKQ